MPSWSTRTPSKTYPDYFDAHFNLGRLYLDKQGYADAIKELREAVRIKPNDADAHNNLGLALKRNGDLNGAILEYRQAVQLNPKLASAQNNLANVLYAKRDYAGAIQHYRAALEIQPKSAQTRMNLGSALDDAGKADDAIAEYKEALKLDPKNAKIHYNLSIVYQKKKDFPAAIAELKAAAKLLPDWPTPHIMLTNLLKDSDPKAAIERVHGRRRPHARCQTARPVHGTAEEGAIEQVAVIGLLHPRLHASSRRRAIDGCGGSDGGPFDGCHRPSCRTSGGCDCGSGQGTARRSPGLRTCALRQARVR